MGSPAKIPAATPSADAVDYKLIALLSAAHLSDDVNQGAVPAMLPFLIAAGHLTYAAAAGRGGLNHSGQHTESRFGYKAHLAADEKRNRRLSEIRYPRTRHPPPRLRDHRPSLASGMPH
jgi:hypothetical protein